MCLIKREHFTWCDDGTEFLCIEDTPLNLCEDQENCEKVYAERWVNDYCHAHPNHVGHETESENEDEDNDEDNDDDDDDDDDDESEVEDSEDGEDESVPADAGSEMEIDAPDPAPAASGVNVPASSQERRQTHLNDNAHATIEAGYFDDAMSSAPANPAPDASMGIPPLFDAHVFTPGTGNVPPNLAAVPPFCDINGVSYPQNLQMFEQPSLGPGLGLGLEPGFGSQDILSGEFGLPYTPGNAVNNGNGNNSAAQTRVVFEECPGLPELTLDHIDLEAIREFTQSVNPMSFGMPPWMSSAQSGPGARLGGSSGPTMAGTDNAVVNTVVDVDMTMQGADNGDNPTNAIVNDNNNNNNMTMPLDDGNRPADTSAVTPAAVPASSPFLHHMEAHAQDPVSSTTKTQCASSELSLTNNPEDSPNTCNLDIKRESEIQSDSDSDSEHNNHHHNDTSPIPTSTPAPPPSLKRTKPDNHTPAPTPTTAPAVSDSAPTSKPTDDIAVVIPVQGPAPHLPAPDITTPSAYTCMSESCTETETERATPVSQGTMTPTPKAVAEAEAIDGEEDGGDADGNGEDRPRKRRRKGRNLVVRKYAWKRKG